MMLYPLTLRVSLEDNVCYAHSLESNFEIKHKFMKYLKESYCLASDEHFSFKYFHKNAFLSKIFQKNHQASFGRSECKRVNHGNDPFHCHEYKHLLQL